MPEDPKPKCECQECKIVEQLYKKLEPKLIVLVATTLVNLTQQ